MLSRSRRWLIILHAVLAAYVLPAFFLAGQPLVPGSSLVSGYRMSAIAVVGLLAGIWSIAYWTIGFYPRIYRLSPGVQARTGARIRVGRSLGWDRPVGWRAAIGLQFRFLGLLMGTFAVWGLLMVTTVVTLTFLHEGPTGVVKFLRGK